MGSFELSGTKIEASSVSSWPLLNGDVVATGSVPAVVFLQGKGSLTLNANSRVSVTEHAGQMDVRLVDGSMSYHLSTASNVKLYSGAQSYSGKSDGTLTATRPSSAGGSSRGQNFGSQYMTSPESRSPAIPKRF
jgi:hypothetical protein